MPLTDEQIMREEKFLKGLPRVNWGAFFMPPIWGPAHGFWVTILWYPAWLLADNVVYWATEAPTPLSVILAVLTLVILLVVTVVFAIVSQPFAAHRAEERGTSRETYLRRERIWAIASFLIAAVMVALATYYNLAIRPGVEA